MDLDSALISAMVIFFVANLIQGFTGFGMGIFAVTGLTLFGEIVHATILTNLAGLITVSMVFGRLWRHTSWRHLLPVMLGIAVFNPVGLALLKYFGPTHPDTVRRALGLVIIGFALWSLWNKTPKPRARIWPIGLAAGMVGGILGGAFTMSGPALVAYVYSLPLERDAMKASVNACFLFNCVYRLIQLVSAGDITRPVLVQFAWCVPAIFLGVGLGLVLARGVSTERFRRYAWIAFGLLGLILIAR